MFARVIALLAIMGAFIVAPMVAPANAKPGKSEITRTSAKVKKAQRRKAARALRRRKRMRRASTRSAALSGTRSSVRSGLRRKKTAYRRGAYKKAAYKKAIRATGGKKKNARYKAKKVKAKKVSYAALGIKNMRHASQTRKGRMSTKADMRKNTIRQWERRVGRKYRPGAIVISNYTRRLYYVLRPGKVISYPIATPRPSEIWSGKTTISEKQINPDWYPTPDMRRKNPRLPVKVAGGSPANPFGKRALYLGKSLYRIHGTNNPGSIGSSASGGCYRMYNRHIRALYNRVKVGAPVLVTNKRSL